VLAYGLDYGWTTNMPIEQFLAEDALVAILHDGEPLPSTTAPPGAVDCSPVVRLEERQVDSRVEFLEKDKAGFWERKRMLSYEWRSLEGRAFWLLVLQQVHRGEGGLARLALPVSRDGHLRLSEGRRRSGRQYVRDMQRPVTLPGTKPRVESRPDRGIFAAWLGHSTVLLKSTALQSH